MLKIYIVRHGQDQDNAAGILNGHRNQSLTALGKKQARILADNLVQKNLEFSGFYVSPLKRARETAAIIAKKLKLKAPRVWPELIERDFGIMTGKPLSDLIILCSPHIIMAEKVNYILKPYGGETFPQLMARARKVLARVRREHKSGNVLLVAHGDIGKMIFAAYYGLSWQKVIKLFYFDNSDALVLAPKMDYRQAYIKK